MPSIDVSENVKERLEKVKEKYGCKTYSEAVNIILLLLEEKEKANKSSSNSQ